MGLAGDRRRCKRCSTRWHLHWWPVALPAGKKGGAFPPIPKHAGKRDRLVPIQAHDVLHGQGCAGDRGAGGNIIGDVEGNQAAANAYRRRGLAVLVRATDVNVAQPVAQLGSTRAGW